MRTATFVVVLAIHAMLFYLFALLRTPARQASSGQEAPATLLLLQEAEPEGAAPEPVGAGKPRLRAHEPPVKPRVVRQAAPEAPATVSSAPKTQPDSSAITPTPAPDWRAEAESAANDEIEAEVRKRAQPSPLAPHDFSKVKPGSTDDSKPQFGWNHAHTHRVEGAPGAFVVNVNDRCAIALVLIFPFPVCKVGKMPAARGDLFEHLHDAAAAGESNLP